MKNVYNEVDINALKKTYRKIIVTVSYIFASLQYSITALICDSFLVWQWPQLAQSVFAILVIPPVLLSLVAMYQMDHHIDNLFKQTQVKLEHSNNDDTHDAT